MDWNTLFILANTIVMPAWFLLWFLPDSEITQRVVYSYLYPFLLGISYVVLLVLSFGQADSISMEAFSTVEGLQALFSSKGALVAGWMHYLLFDLFVGMWIARDAMQLGISKWIVLAPLFFTLMAGPLGLVLYLGVRYRYTRSFMY